MALFVDTAACCRFTIFTMDDAATDYKTTLAMAASAMRYQSVTGYSPPAHLYEPDTGYVMIWSPQRLTWNNFEEEQPFTDKYPRTLAKTHWEFRYGIGNISSDTGGTTLQVKVYALFIPSLSWVRPVNIGRPEVLVHEQLHFDIVELVARQLRQTLAGLSLNQRNYKKLVAKAYNRAFASLNDMQYDFDNAVSNDVTTATRASWLASITEKIAALDKYKNPEVLVPLQRD